MKKILEITSNDHIIMIDKLCKRILGHPEILGRIVKGFIKEAKGVSLEEIIELIKGKKDQEGNSYFQQLNNVIDIAHHGRVEFDYFCCINLPQAAKKRDGHVNCINSKLENISGSTIERLESYDKSEQIMIYLNKDHNIKDKYEESDWIKTPLVIFLNNTYDLLIKKEVMKEYGFEEIEKEVKKMCNLGEMIARENIEKGLIQGQKKKNIELITNLMNSLNISFLKAVELLKVSEDEVLEIEKYFES